MMISNSIRYIPALMAAAFLACVTSSMATTFQVGGGSAYKTIQSAVDAANNGDTIQIEPGRYDESILCERDLMFLGAGPQHVSIRPGAGQAIRVAEFAKVSLIGMTFSSADNNAIQVGLSAHLTVRHCVIAGAFIHGISHHSEQSSESGRGPTLVMEHVTISGCGYYGIEWDCFETRSGAVTIRNCILANTNRRGGDWCMVARVAFYDGSYIMFSGKPPWWNGNNIAGNWLAGDPRFVSADNFQFTLRDGSPAKDKGFSSLSSMDPDGTAPDLGAYGGALSAPFWPYPANGPLIKSVALPQSTVVQGGKLTIRATATTR